MEHGLSLSPSVSQSDEWGDMFPQKLETTYPATWHRIPGDLIPATSYFVSITDLIIRSSFT